MNSVKNKIADLWKWVCRHNKPTAYSILATVLCYFTLYTLRDAYSPSIIFLSCIVSYFASVRVGESCRNILQFFDTAWKKLLLVFMSVYGIIAFTGIYFLDVRGTYDFPFNSVWYLIFSAIWVVPIILGMISLLVNGIKKVEVNSGRVRVSLKFRMTLIVLFILPCVIFLIAFNPAITSYDSEYNYIQAQILGQEGIVTIDWQPVFYAALVGFFLSIHKSITFLIIVQVVYFAIVFSDVIAFLIENGINKRLALLFYVFIAYGYSNILQMDTLWRDIPYLASLLWMTLLLMKYLINKEHYVKGVKWYIEFFISVIFVSLIRQNGILVTAVVMILLCIYARRNKWIIVTSILCISAFGLIKGPVYKYVWNAEPAPQLKYLALTNDIIYLYYNEGNISDEGMELLNIVTDNDPWGEEHPERRWYEAYYMNFYDFEDQEKLGSYTIPHFLSIYFDNFIHNPVEMSRAIMKRNSIIWSIVKPVPERASCVNFYVEYNDKLAYPLRVENILTRILTKFCDFMRKDSVLYIFIWRTGIYNLLILLLCAIGLAVLKRKDLVLMIPFIPICINVITLFIASGWTPYRYYWPSMIMGVFLLYYSLIVYKPHVISAATKKICE